ncbi:MAG: ABC transporter permease [Proteobacteria bacterium]|nr:ABC transporter permease [Pseudomonadota bacterium]MBI3498486.1 ABC transporter permease [Pseudomonadota bacterium]
MGLRITDAVNAIDASPLGPFRSLWRHRALILEMARREVEMRYRGSFLGVFWSIITPVLTLLVYTFVFRFVFQVRWGDQPGGTGEFAVVLFAGLIVFWCFADAVGRAPSLILAQGMFVKKVVFPLEALVAVAIVASFFQLAVNTAILLVASLVLGGTLSWSMLAFPLILVPFALGLIGICWVLAAAGVYLRDIGQVIQLLVMLLMFVVPLFYPVSAVPESFRFWIEWNPLGFFITEARNSLLWGIMPDWRALALATGGAWVVAWLGYLAFMKARRGFADVI